jgi:uncharacterized protein (TIGR02145 family)
MTSRFLLIITMITVNTFCLHAQKTGSFKDQRDGKTYKTVKIGSQTWLAENLYYKTDSGSCCYGYNDSNCVEYGRLYTWEMAKKACPSGWHLPGDNEWTTLFDYLGGEDVAGVKLKSSEGWESEKNDSTNSSGFSALPGGVTSYDSTYSGLGKWGYWWTSLEQPDNTARLIFLYYKSTYSVGRTEYDRSMYHSVRCVKD